MQASNFYKKKLHNKTKFPTTHILCCAIVTFLTLATYFSIPSNTYSFSNDDQIYIPLNLDFDEIVTRLNAEEQAKHQSEKLVKTNSSHDDWEKIKIEKGDNLQIIFRKLQIPSEEYNLLWKYSKKFLKDLNPQQELILQFSDNKKIEAVRFKKSILESYSFVRKDSKYIRKDNIREPRIRYQHHIVQIQSTLSEALAKTSNELNTQTIRTQINAALSSHVNFKKIQKNDVIHLLTEEKYIDDQSLGYGNILAAQYDGKRVDYTAYRYKSLDGTSDYYSPKVKSKYKTVRQATNGSSFLRNPVPGARISSHFSHNRLHPILKTRRPHLGTDFAARTGTPVLSPSNGRVVRSSFSRANGNFVVIKHGHITTKYLHLHRRYVKNGQSVKQGQTIGSVGSTGLSSGPHLHYEVLVNGSHKNPLNISKYSPKAYRNVQVAIKTPGAIPSNERKRFFEQTRGIRLQFAAATRQSKSQLASQATQSNIELANVDSSNTRHN